MRSESLISPLLSALCTAVVLIVGCGGSIQNAAPFETVEVMAPSTVDSEGIAFADTSIDASTADPHSADVEIIERKIIYSADLDLEVTEFDKVPALIKQAVRQHGGYVASSNFQGSSGSRRSGTWTIKVPTAKYGDFLTHAESIGELQSLSEETVEVTAEYYDLEARIRTKQEEEKRMLQHLAEDTKELKDTLAVEKELMRIREELERFQGQLRLLAHRVDFSTITIRVYEYRIYEPEERIGFVAEIQRAFSTSLEQIVSFLRGVVLAIVVLSPWLVMLGLPVAVIVRFVHKRMTVSQKT